MLRSAAASYGAWAWTWSSAAAAAGGGGAHHCPIVRVSDDLGVFEVLFLNSVLNNDFIELKKMTSTGSVRDPPPRAVDTG